MLSATIKLLKNEEGMSLLELVISIGILTIIIIPLTNTMLTAARVNANSEELMIASQEAQQIIEQERAGLPYTNSNTGYSSRVTAGQAYEAYIIRPETTNYSAVMTLEEKEEQSLLIYKNDDGQLIKMGQEDFQSGEEWWLQVYSNQLILIKNLATYTIAYNQPQPILSVENYGEGDMSIRVTNYTPEPCYIYTSQVHGEYTESFTITKDQGEVIIREVRQMKERTPQNDENMLRHVKVEVSPGTVYKEEDKRAEINTLIKE